jgi:CHASE3 domain sensor protein/class 3 adenylate cyclase
MKLSLLQKVIAGFGLASALLIMVTYSGYQSARRLAQTKEWELHTIQVMSLLEDIMADIADAETGQRGYLLTGEERYLQPYKETLAEIWDELAKLKKLTSDNQNQQQQLVVLEALVDKKLTELEKTIQLRRSGNVRAAVGIVRTNQGKTVMDGIRQVIDRMENEEERLFQERSQVTQAVIQRSFWTCSLGIILDVGVLSILYTRIYREIRQRTLAESQLIQLNQAALRFVPEKFIQLLNKESLLDVKLGEQVQQEMSILFSDIRAFTTLSESLTPEDNFRFINAYLARMGPAITAHHGFIDKYIGDAIMALFSRSADDAVQAGITMLNVLREYNQHRANSGYVPIQIGVGINTGALRLGTVGEQNRMDGTVIGDAVNLASRIEQLTKTYGVSLLISHHTLSQLEDPSKYAIRLIDRVKVKGKSEMVSVYEVFDADPTEVFSAKQATLTAFTEAVLLYHQQEISKAAEQFEWCLKVNPIDPVLQIYLKRCHNTDYSPSVQFTQLIPLSLREGDR